MIDCEQNQKPTLIYFMTRGNAQIIRCVLFQIGVQFNEVFVSTNGYLDPNLIKKFNIDLKNLPYLIHNNLVIYGIFPIMKYLCLRYNRLDLLGNTIQDSILVAQVMAKQIRQKGVILHTLFKGLKQVRDKKLGHQGLLQLKKKMIETTSGKSIFVLKKMFSQHGTFTYIFGYLTVLDFFYFEKSFYGTNLIQNSITQIPEINLARQYKKFFESTEFWKKHGDKLDKYKVFFPEVDCSLNDLIKQMWLGDPKYITNIDPEQ